MARKKKLEIGQPDYQTIYDWSGGMNDVINPALLNDNESPRLENVSLDEKGTLYPAKGRRERYGDLFSDKAINGLGAYYKSDGTSRLVIGADNELYTDSPHHINTFDSQSELEGGSKQNVEIKDGKVEPAQLPLPTFTRDSEAYLSDGTKVSVKQPRFERGYFHNLLEDEDMDFSTFTAHRGSSVTVTQGHTVAEWGTNNATRIQTTGGDSTTKYYKDIVNLPPEGEAYTVSVYVKNMGNTDVVVATNITNYGDGVVRHGESRRVVLPAEGNNKSHLQLAFRTLEVPDNIDILVWRPQAEQRSFATEWILPSRGKGVLVEQGTTNLLYKDMRPSAGFQHIAVNGFEWAGRFTLTERGFAHIGATNIDIPATPNTAYTLTYYARLVSGSVVPGTQIYIGTDSQGNFAAKLDIENTLNDQWQKFTVSGYTDANATTITRAAFRVQTTSECVVEIANWQLEKKKYRTTFTDDTRSSEALSIPAEGVLNPREGTIELRCKLLSPYDYSDVFIRRIFFTGTLSNDNYIQISLRTWNDFIRLYIGDGKGSVKAISFTFGDFGEMDFYNSYHYIVAKWSQAKDMIYFRVDDKIKTKTYTSSVPTLSDTACIGNMDGVQQANAIIADMRISAIARTDEEIQAAYESNAPLPADEWTTYKLNFDNNLLPAYDDIDLGLSKIDTAHYNNTYWLISGDSGKVKKYDGTEVTDLTTEFGLDGTIVRDIGHGSYWLVAGDGGKIKKYDGSSVTDLTETLEFGTSAIKTLAWSGLYWLIAGADGKVKKYDGTVKDLTEDFEFGSEAINAIAWSGAYFLVGGTNGKIKKYDGSTVTDITSTISLGTSTINTIKWNGEHFLIGTADGKLKEYDGTTVTDLTSTFAFGTDGVRSISWNGIYWLVSATNGKIKKYDGDTVTDLTNIFNITSAEAPAIYHSDYYIVNGDSKTIKFYYLPDEYTYSWYSPAIDVSSATDKSSGHIAVDVSLPGGTAMTVKSRSSDDGKTWSDWYAASFDGDLMHPAANYIQLVVQLKKSGKNKPEFSKVTVSFDGTAGTTLLSSDFSQGGQFYMDTLLDKMIIVNGIDPPRKYDGDKIETLGGSPPQGSYVVSHKNRLWTVRGSRLYFSDLLNIESWPVLNFIDISPNDGDQINSIIVYGDYLVIAKSHSIWMLSGEGPSTFSVRKIHSDKGVYAPRSLIVVDGSLCFVANDGIYLSDLTEHVLISERIRNYWNSLNPRRIKQAASYYTESKLYVAVPEGTSMINNSVIVFDTLRKAFVGVRMGWNVNCWLKFYEADKRVSLFGHSDKGQLSEINVGYSDNGDPYDFIWKSKEFDFNSSESYKRWNRIYMDVKPSKYDATIDVGFNVDGRHIGSFPVDIPKGDGDEVHSMLILASKAGVVGGRRLSMSVKQSVKDNPIGIQRVSIEHISHGAKPTHYGW